MLESFFSFFEKLIDAPSSKRLIFISILVAGAAIGLAGYEWYTSTFALTRIEHELKLLDQLVQSAKNADLKPPPKAQEAYESLAKDLNNIVASNPQVIGRPIEVNSIPNWLKKAVATIIPWILLAIIMRLASSNISKSIAGIVVIVIPLTIVSVFIPDFSNKWVNYFWYPWGSFVVLLFLITVFDKVITNRVPNSTP